MFPCETTTSHTRATISPIVAFAVILPLLISLASLAPTLRAALTIDTLRCENLDSPLGIDSEKPRLSWRISSPERGENQIAYEILVATTADRLARDQADLWTSGRVASAETLNIPYNGRPLATSQQVFWKVRVWSNDNTGQPTPWSATATFTLGVLNDTWQPGAQWITSPDLLKYERKTPGFCTREAKNENVTKWVQLDLGAPQKIDAVILRAIQHTLQERYGFPLRFKIEASDDPAFKKPDRVQLISDDTAADIDPELPTITRAPSENQPLTARYIRVIATKLRTPDDGKPTLALGQIEVLSGPDKKNIALNAPVTASDLSEDTARFSPQALTDGLDTPAKNPNANSTLLLRREFTIRAGLVRALAHITGLGHYELTANAAPITTGLLTPGWTDTDKTILYDTYDITSQLHEGPNALALTLAGGFYNIQPDPQKRYHKLTTAFRPLCAYGQIRLEYDDGLVETINTDTSWRATTNGPVTYANLYGGEDYDARRKLRAWTEPGFDDTAWPRAVTTTGPAGKLRGATLATPPFRHFETLQSVSIKQIHTGLAVADFGQNAPMMPALRVRGPAGSTVRLTPSELVDAGGAIDRRSAGGGSAYWQYTLRGDPLGETWTPDFFYQGARYLQIELIASSTGDASLPVVEKIESLVTHSDTPPAGDFSCSNDLFNRIRTLVRWAQRSNLAHVLTDCPHREKLGWLEQYYLNGPSLRYEWNIARLYTKTFQDMADAQTATGLIPDIAPEYTIFSGGFRDSPEWGSAFILAAWQHYLWTSDTQPLRTHFAAMDDYVEYLGTRAKKYILSHGLGDWYDIGPKPPGAAQLTPIELTATAAYYDATNTLARIATVIGRDEDAARLSKEATRIAEAFNRSFLNTANPADKKNPRAAAYATGSQTAQAMPLVLDLVPAERRAAALDTLIARLHADGDTSTAGDIGYRYLLRALADNGRSDLIAKMISRDDKPGYAWQLAHGATSLTEAWDARPDSSQNHFMLGQITEWFYANLAGLQPDPDGPGFSKIIIKPQPVAEVTWARASYESPRGPVSVSWKIGAGKFILEIAIPTGSTATVYIPTKNPTTVREGENFAARSKGVRALLGGASATEAIYAVESGRYVFTAEY